MFERKILLYTYREILCQTEISQSMNLLITDLLGKIANPWENSDPVYAVNVTITSNRHLLSFISQKNLQEHQLNTSRLPVFPREIAHSRRFPVFPQAADTLSLCSCFRDEMHLVLAEWNRLTMKGKSEQHLSDKHVNHSEEAMFRWKGDRSWQGGAAARRLWTHWSQWRGTAEMSL